MLTYFKNRVQEFGFLALLSFFSSILNAQPAHLSAEIDLLSGLPSNGVRVIRKDTKGRIWVGTHQGLQVLNYSDPYLDSLHAYFQNKPIWALEFYKDYAVIGTGFNGVYIIDLLKNKNIVSFDTTVIGKVRKFRLISDTLFIATRSHPSYITLSDLKLHHIRTSQNGFTTDFTKWKGEILMSFYQDPMAEIYLLKNDSLVADHRFNLKRYPPLGNSLSIQAKDENLVIGGNGFNLLVDSASNITSEILRNPITNKCLPAWDIEWVNKKPYIITGDPDNLRQGMIHEPFITSSGELKNNFYGISLYYDRSRKGLWAGTENAGLFYWPSPDAYHHIPSQILDQDFKVIPCKNGSVLLYDKSQVIFTDMHRFKVLYNQPDGSILDVKWWNDTLAILTSRNILLFRNGSVLANKKLTTALFNKVERKGNSLLLFSMFDNVLEKIDIGTLHADHIYLPSNEITIRPYKSGVIYHSNYTGFIYYDTAVHVFRPGFPSNESFTYSNDTLWTFNSGVISSFRIDIKNDSLLPLSKINLKNLVKGFAPKWLVSVNHRIYCGNNSGFIRINSSTCQPEEYYYTGNHSEGTNPSTFNDTIYFQHTNYFAALTPQDLAYSITPSSFTVSTSPGSGINENSPFFIEIRTNDYLVEKHSLKQILLIDRNQDTIQYYTTENRYELPSGLSKGDYEMIISVNGIEVSRSRIKVIVPLTSNPLFYLAAFTFLAAFAGLWIIYSFNKRKYEKQILNNRLQLLKQNLNPHFIFNSLNLIYSLVLQKKNDAAIKTINNFSDLHRYYLENINKAEIKLSEELSFIESYLKLESERREVDDPFKYILPDLPADVEQYMVPPMILQPLVENAVKYCGPDLDLSSQSLIWIDFVTDHDRFVISIENTLNQEKPKTILGNGLGLKLVEERIDIYNKFYKKQVRISNNVQCRHTKSGYRTEIQL